MKMKGATPVKQNQGTDARQQKNILAKPKMFLTENADWHGRVQILLRLYGKLIFCEAKTIRGNSCN